MPDPAPIGIFDSGVGGLSVMRIMRAMLPYEDMIYFADSAYCPYGTRPPEITRKRAIALCQFLISRGAKLVVVACNTASSASLNELRKLYPIPIVGMEPALKPAAAITRNKKIGILATGATISGERFGSLVKRYGNGIDIISQPCPGLVELVEAGEINGARTEEMLKLYLDPLIKEGVDTVVLGCTHYPFLRPMIESMLGNRIQVIDTGEAVARRVIQVLKENDLNTPDQKPGIEIFYTSGQPEEVKKVIQKLWLDNDVTVAKVHIK